jgi:orotidine-5'-phosphate decarboxylase
VAEIVVALDLPDPDAALRLVERLPGIRWVKVGSVLMTRAGAPFVQELRRRQLRVFLDLKWHDIPNTVAGAVAAARDLGVAMATVHTVGGRAMLEAAAGAAGPDLALVGVTVLTSHDAASYAEAVGREHVVISEEAERLTRIALGAGISGLVCSPHLLGPAAPIVVPGIRRRSDGVGDQARVSTAGDAARLGATHLVVGRPVLQARDPAAAFRELAAEVA